MAFWEGVKKIFSGIEEIASTPGEILVDIKYKRRVALSGKYKVHIPEEYGYPTLIADITFNGGANIHDINHITYAHGTVDVWDELSDNAKMHVNSRIKLFLTNLMNKNSANLY